MGFWGFGVLGFWAECVWNTARHEFDTVFPGMSRALPLGGKAGLETVLNEMSCAQFFFAFLSHAYHSAAAEMLKPTANLEEAINRLRRATWGWSEKSEAEGQSGSSILGSTSLGWELRSVAQLKGCDRNTKSLEPKGQTRNKRKSSYLSCG